MFTTDCTFLTPDPFILLHFQSVTPHFNCLSQQADLSHRRLGRAGKLTALLGDEMARWQATADDLAARIALLPGDALLAAACISYTGAFTGDAAAALKGYRGACVSYTGAFMGEVAGCFEGSSFAP